MACQDVNTTSPALPCTGSERITGPAVHLKQPETWSRSQRNDAAVAGHGGMDHLGDADQ